MNGPAESNPELDALLGAYALDALEPDERLRVEKYLAANPRARDEVDEMLESAAALAMAPVDDATAPPELWERISSTIDDDVADTARAGGVDAAPGDELGERRARWSERNVRLMSLAVAAVAVVVALLGAQVISLHRRLDDAHGTGEKQIAAAFVRAGHAPGARQVALMPSEGAEVARVVLLPDGSGYVKNDGLERLDPDQVYQLWALTGDPTKPVAISAAVLGSDPNAAAFQTAKDVHGFALTIERAPGVGQSKQQPVATASVS